MKQTVNFSQFCDAFTATGRGAQFSYAAKRALYDYLDEWEDETGDEIELDVIALCCAFAEYENLDEFRAEYGDDYVTIESIEQITAVIPIPDSAGFLIEVF